MRPTLRQIYCKTDLVIVALEEAGMPAAHARVMRLMDRLIEYWSMHRYCKRLVQDRQYSLQVEDRRRSHEKDKSRDRDSSKRHKKSMAYLNRTIDVARGYLNRMEARLERKVSKWPDLNLDPSAFRKKPDRLVTNKVLKKRRAKNKSRISVLI